MVLRKNAFLVVKGLLLASLLTTGLLCFGTDIQLVRGESDFIDNFNSSTLSSEWATTDPDGGSTFDLTVNPGWLRITSPSGRDLLPVKFNAPRISQVVSGDFIVETKISAVADENDEGAGILIWKDSSNYVRLDRISRTIGHPVEQQVLFGGSVDGVWPCPGDTNVVLPSNINPTYLKLIRSNSILTGWYSSDGASWTQVGTIPFNVTDPVNIGLAVVNEYHTGDFYADFDFFNMDVPPTADGLVGYWKLDEGSGTFANDDSGNGNTGNLVGNPLYIDGVSGKALQFDGVDDYVSIPDSQSLRIQSFTLAAWIYMTERPYQHGSRHSSIFNKFHYQIGTGDTGFTFTFVDPTSTDDNLMIAIGDGIDDRQLVRYNSINDLTLNQWHFVTGTWDGSIASIYIDGQLKSSANTDEYTIAYDSTPLALGTEVASGAKDVWFKGIIDEAMVYNKTLTAEEIQDAYNSYFEDLRGYWKLDKGSGTTAFDSSAYGNNGILMNGPEWVDGVSGKALRFDGLDDYVNCGRLGNFGSTGLGTVSSYAFWFETSQTAFSCILGSANDYPSMAMVIHFNVPEVNKIRFYLRDNDFKRLSADLETPFNFTGTGWHHFAAVVDASNNSIKMFIDGVSQPLVYTYQESPIAFSDFQYPLFFGAFDFGGTIEYEYPITPLPMETYAGAIDEVRVYNAALSAGEITALYNSVAELAKPTLELSCSSSTSYSGFKVEMQGNLENNETAIAAAPILLSYSVNGGKSWEDLTLVHTASDGSYSATWNPSVTGSYLIKATYEGDETNLGTAKIVNLAITPYGNNNVFSVSSNSTVSSLVFESEHNELRFSVSGESGTTGYADVYIAKTLVQDPSNIEVIFDEEELNYTVTSTEDAWLLHFTYTHSIHNVVVNLESAIIPEFSGWLFLTFLISTTLIWVVLRKRLKKREV